VEPGSQFIVSDCFQRQDGVRSQFCDLISTDSLPDSRMLVSGVAAEFINFDTETVSGIDINATLGKEVTAFNKTVDLGLNVRANKLLERSSVFIDDEGVETFDEDAGEFGFPEWTGRARFSAEVDKFLFTWEARYIGEVAQDPDGLDDFGDAFGDNDLGAISDTCLGTAAGDVLCRDVGFADDYMTHSASIRYRDDSWTLRAGVSNIFDRDPPLVDSSEVLAISNTPIGNGYDLDGREFFMSVTKQF